MMADRITDADVQRSYHLLALIGLCRHVANDVSGAGTGDWITRAADDIGTALDLADQLAGEIHDALEGAQRCDDRSNKAATA
jgi:hypothetical protein